MKYSLRQCFENILNKMFIKILQKVARRVWQFILVQFSKIKYLSNKKQLKEIYKYKSIKTLGIISKNAKSRNWHAKAV